MSSSSAPSLGVVSVTIDLARPVHGDDPLVARPIGARNNLARVVEPLAVGVVRIDRLPGHEELALFGDRVGDKQVRGYPGRLIVAVSRPAEHPAALQGIGLADEPAPSPTRNGWTAAVCKLMEDSLPGSSRRRVGASIGPIDSDRRDAPEAALPGSMVIRRSENCIPPCAKSTSTQVNAAIEPRSPDSQSTQQRTYASLHRRPSTTWLHPTCEDGECGVSRETNEPVRPWGGDASDATALASSSVMVKKRSSFMIARRSCTIGWTW